MRTCPIAAGNIKGQLIVKNDYFEFSSYSGYILQLKWTKAKLLM